MAMTCGQTCWKTCVDGICVNLLQPAWHGRGYHSLIPLGIQYIAIGCRPVDSQAQLLKNVSH